MKLVCPECGNEVRSNKGWAAMFYAGYCNHCDMPIEDPICEGDEYEAGASEASRNLCCEA